MKKGTGLGTSKDRKDIIPDNWESKTKKIQKQSSKKVLDVLLLLQKDFIQEIRKCYCEHSDTKLLLEIPELKDIKINVAEIAPNGFSTMHISTSFKGNLHKLLSKHKFENGLVYHAGKNKIHGESTSMEVILEGGILHLFIDQPEL